MGLLTQTEFEQYRAAEVARVTQHAKPATKPRAVLLAGQPGAGKSNAREAALKELSEGGDGAVVVDPDDARAAHPRYPTLMRQDDRTAAALTHVEASAVAEASRDAAIAQGMNIVIDGTMKSPDKAKQLVQTLVDAGYEVDVVALCVDPAESWAGVQSRYEAQKAKSGYGRWVPRDVHDAAATGMVDSLLQLQEQGLVDNLTVVNRSGDVLFESAPSSEGGKSVAPGDIRSVFEQHGGRTPQHSSASAGGGGGGGGGGRPQARIGDMHVCPLVTGVVPHVGGPVTIGCPSVLVGSMPAARIGDMVTCVGPPDTIAMGSATVMIGGKPAARLGDMTAHGGQIVVGMPTVLTGG